jgi:hypothetical protein
MAMMAIFAVEAAAEAAALAEAAAAAATAETAATTAATATTAAETAAAQQAAQQAATAALTAGELGSAASGITSVPTSFAVPQGSMALDAAAGGQGAAAGLEQATAAMQQGAVQLPPAGLEQLPAGGPPPGAVTSSVTPPNVSSINPVTGVPSSFSPSFDPTSGIGPPPMPAAPPPAPAGIPSASPVPPPPTTPSFAGPPEMARPYTPLSVSGPPPGAEAYIGGQTPGGMYTLPGEGGIAPTSAFERGLDKAMAFVDKYPKTSMAGAYLGASALGLLDPNRGNFNSSPYSGPLSKYKLSGNYQPGNADPSQYRYTPRYAEGGIMQMAEGGITGSGNLTLNVPLDLGGGQNGGQSTPNFAFGGGNSGANTGFFGQNSSQPTQSSMAQQNNTAPINVGGPADASQTQNFARGGSTGNLSSTLDYYTKMMEGETPKIPAQHPEGVGIYHDTDPDTRSLDPYSAARTRLAKTNKRAYVTAPKGPEPYVGGQLNFNPPGAKSSDTTQYQEAAKGGIMGLSNLGGYAAGGNPRLLKGPGDGMSDNIPATINGRQPARLADGEFVIPADVVSHLGNGSTEAGAKVLHQMMTKVRRERTGNPKQGKQINPRKYIPR